MRLPPRCTSLALAIAAAFAAHPAAAAEPLATAGIGLQVCSKLTPAMNPAQGLDNQANYLIVYWAQGYLSAANITTLEADGEYLDLAVYGPEKIISIVHEFCTKNPDKKPISAFDDVLTNGPKLKGAWEKGTIGWAAEE